MPPITRWFVRTAMVYLVLALCTGLVLVWPGGAPLSGFFPVYFHTLAFGWLTQLIFGIALWMFPKYSAAQPRGPEWLGWVTYVLLNVGLVLRIIFEPLNSGAPSSLSGWMLVISAVLQWLAGVGFIINSWSRVREK